MKICEKSLFDEYQTKLDGTIRVGLSRNQTDGFDLPMTQYMVKSTTGRYQILRRINKEKDISRQLNSHGKFANAIGKFAELQ